MEVIYHPLVRRDVLEVMCYYQAISDRLANEFEDDLRATINHAKANPHRFPAFHLGFRRANLKRFPYHILYEADEAALRVMLVRHHKRNPEFGIHRTL